MWRQKSSAQRRKKINIRMSPAAIKIIVMKMSRHSVVNILKIVSKTSTSIFHNFSFLYENHLFCSCTASWRLNHICVWLWSSTVLKWIMIEWLHINCELAHTTSPYARVYLLRLLIRSLVHRLVFPSHNILNPVNTCYVMTWSTFSDKDRQRKLQQRK